MFGSSSPPVFAGGLLSYLRYLCLFTHSGVQHILCCVFVLFFLVLCTLCFKFLWIVHLLITPLYSLTFIHVLVEITENKCDLLHFEVIFSV